MPDLPRLGACVYLDDLDRVPGLRDWLGAERDVEIRDFTAIGALTPGVREGIATRAAQVFAGHRGRIGIHGPFWGFNIDMPDPDLRAVVQDRMLAALAALETVLAGRGGGHMVLHSPFTTWSGFNRGTEMDDQAGITARTLEVLAPVVARAEASGIVIVIENCEDRDPFERVTLAAAFGSPAVRVSLDTGHALYAHGSTGAPPVDAYVRAAGAALAHVHLQDADGVADRHWACGRGSVNWDALFRALSELGTLPRLLLEMADARDVLVSARYLAERGLAA